MSPSGAEIIKQIKERIHEADPAEVRAGLGNGVVLVDVREGEEFERERIPGAVHVPRGYLESRIEGAVSDRDAHVVLYCASGQRSALAADTLENLLGYTNVESMTGGITLWKDRGDETEVPKTLSKEQRDRYSRHLLLPQVRLASSNVIELIEPYDIVVDGLDNFPTRYLLNDASVRLRKPVVSASILGFDGQISTFVPYEGPCYRCLYPVPPPPEMAPSCGAAGVLGVMAGGMGLLQANEGIKLSAGVGEPLIGRLLLYDSLGP